ncbi:MAG: hypothetical protein BWK72_13275 [Rhodoferax ferrireducens]|uniref:Uncharacterized protein n=1 Tax=Rhodoferax ferrireducens TaxID=192843 RepID=A0A1W9KSV7_9BURK|nr:MAG: hypothetical protein BWK72_13275 [Rhodoferax ferrireducens]
MNPSSASPAGQTLPRRGSSLALGLLGALLLACLAAVGHTAWAQRQAARQPNPSAALVKALHLTDLALFTEARYTRHLSQADAFAAFQDGPVALEHFPAGSLVMPNRTFPPSGFADGNALR